MSASLKPFFYFDNLKLWEKWVMSIYAIITLLIGTTYYFEDELDKRNLLISYTLSSQLFIIFFLYTSLRNFKSYLIWCFFGLIHLIAFCIIKNDLLLQIGKSRPADCLKYTLILLIIFQLFRFLSRSLQGREFIVPGKGQDLFEGKKVKALDYIISFGFFMIWCSMLVNCLHKI